MFLKVDYYKRAKKMKHSSVSFNQIISNQWGPVETADGQGRGGCVMVGL